MLSRISTYATVILLRTYSVFHLATKFESPVIFSGKPSWNAY